MTSEDEFFARQDAEKLRRAAVEQKRKMEQEERERLKALHFMHCPKCGMKLQTVNFKGVQIDRCFSCNGTWLDEGELEALAGKEAGFLNRVVAVFKSEEEK